MRKSLLAGLAAAALFAAPSLAVAQETAGGETWSSLGFITIPGNPLTSFDISWVDTDVNVWYLADRSNASIDLFGIKVNPTVFKIIPAAPNGFAGNVTTCPIANACNGPNGILTFNNLAATPPTRELWVGDGPTMNPVCATSCSTVKVFNANTGALTHVLSTGGTFRADELCVAPPNGTTRPHGLVLMANDADFPPFVTLIATDGPNAYRVIQTIQFPQATNGIEQCQFDPVTQLFYLNVPEVNGPGDDTAPGVVFTINPNVTPATLGPSFTVPIALCAGPQGMAIGTPGNILLGCNAPTPTGPPSFGISNSVVISDAGPGPVVATLVGQGGADQVWFDPTSLHYFITGGSLLPAQELGITDGASNTVDQNIFIGFTGATTRRSHSVASWSGPDAIPGFSPTLTAVFLPVSAVGGSTTAPFSSTVCGSSAAQGCIAVFASSPDTAEPPPD